MYVLCHRRVRRALHAGGRTQLTANEPAIQPRVEAADVFRIRNCLISVCSSWKCSKLLPLRPEDLFLEVVNVTLA